MIIIPTLESLNAASVNDNFFRRPSIEVFQRDFHLVINVAALTRRSIVGLSKWSFFKLELCRSGFSTISQFLERILMEIIGTKNSLDFKLYIECVCSIRIRSRKRDIFGKPQQLNSNPSVTRIFPIRSDICQFNRKRSLVFYPFGRIVFPKQYKLKNTHFYRENLISKWSPTFNVSYDQIIWRFDLSSSPIYSKNKSNIR